MNKTVAMAEAHLAAVEKFRTLGDICDAIGRARTSSASLGKLLRRHIGDDLVERKVDGILYLSLRPARKALVLQLSPPRTYHVVRDLWRGWYNPKTGITGTHLGPDK